MTSSGSGLREVCRKDNGYWIDSISDAAVMELEIQPRTLQRNGFVHMGNQCLWRRLSLDEIWQLALALAQGEGR